MELRLLALGILIVVVGGAISSLTSVPFAVPAVIASVAFLAAFVAAMPSRLREGLFSDALPSAAVIAVVLFIGGSMGTHPLLVTNWPANGGTPGFITREPAFFQTAAGVLLVAAVLAGLLLLSVALSRLLNGPDPVVIQLFAELRPHASQGVAKQRAPRSDARFGRAWAGLVKAWRLVKWAGALLVLVVVVYGLTRLDALRAVAYLLVGTVLLSTLSVLFKSREELVGTQEYRRVTAALGAIGVPLADLVTLAQGFTGVMQHTPELIDLVRTGLVLCGLSTLGVWAGALGLINAQEWHQRWGYGAFVIGCAAAIAAVFLMILLEIAGTW